MSDCLQQKLKIFKCSFPKTPKVFNRTPQVLKFYSVKPQNIWPAKYGITVCTVKIFVTEVQASGPPLGRSPCWINPGATMVHWPIALVASNLQ